MNIKALLGRRNVTSDPLHNFTPCNSFLEDVVDSHILAIDKASLCHDRP